jgi:DNA invertase Pin-like site-specific DNA recombinase
MKIAGYVRQTPGRTNPDTAFAQSERIRRWVLDTANEMIAVCQDHHASSSPIDRPGFKALLDIARSGGADAVVVANLAALSPDKMVQEIMIQDLRVAGATIIATDEDDIEVLMTGADDHTRMVVRDILSRVDDYRNAFGLSGDVEPSVVGTPDTPIVNEAAEITDVVVNLITPDAQQSAR